MKDIFAFQKRLIDSFKSFYTSCSPLSAEDIRKALDVAHGQGCYWKQSLIQIDPKEATGDPDFPSESIRVLKEDELVLFGEYRTQKLVLGAWQNGIGRRRRGKFAAGGGQIANR